jgi:transposase-like protein
VDTKKAVFIIPYGGVRMSKKRRIYPKELKKESVRLIVEEGRRSSELSRELGISAGLLRNWIKLSKVDKIEPFPGQHKRFT